jgi:hypothetical protein
MVGHPASEDAHAKSTSGAVLHLTIAVSIAVFIARLAAARDSRSASLYHSKTGTGSRGAKAEK